MKNKVLKLLSLILCLGMILALCGCTTLDEMKASTGYYQDKNTIVLGGKSYKLVPSCDYFSTNNLKYIKVAEKDVPLLIANQTIAGSDFPINADETVIFGDWKNDKSQEIFARLDRYKDIVERIENEQFFDTLAYLYYDENADASDCTLLANLKAEEVEALNGIISASQSTPISALPEDAYYFTDLQQASNDGIFAKYVGTFYAKYDSKNPTEFIYSVEKDDEAQYFAVPQNYTETLIKLFSKIEY